MFREEMFETELPATAGINSLKIVYVKTQFFISYEEVVYQAKTILKNNTNNNTSGCPHPVNFE